MIDQFMVQARWPHHYLLDMLAINLALASGLTAVLGFRASSTALTILIVFACAGFTVLVGLAVVRQNSIRR